MVRPNVLRAQKKVFYSRKYSENTNNQDNNGFVDTHYASPQDREGNDTILDDTHP